MYKPRLLAHAISLGRRRLVYHATRDYVKPEDRQVDDAVRKYNGHPTEDPQMIEEFVKLLGHDRRLRDARTGIAYRVPTKDIITKLITRETLGQYSVWID